MKTAIYDVIVIGGSASGLQACLTFGRALINVLCIDAGSPCNRYAHESHNFLTNDGESPKAIVSKAREQVLKYSTIKMVNGLVTSVMKDAEHGFKVEFDQQQKDASLFSKRVVFASGINDNIDKIPIKNIGKFWGNSIIPCPFCHGTEFAGQKTGLYFSNPMVLKMMLPMLYNWSKDLKVICSDNVYQALEKETFDAMELKKIEVFKGSIIEAKSGEVNKEGETLSSVVLNNGQSVDLDVLYTHPPFSEINNAKLLKDLGVETEQKFGMDFIKINAQQKTNIEGIYACGDNTIPMRAIAVATYQGCMAASSIVHEIANERW